MLRSNRFTRNNHDWVRSIWRSIRTTDTGETFPASLVLVTLPVPTEYVEKARCNRRRQTSSPVPPPGELNETYASSLIRPILPFPRSTQPSTLRGTVKWVPAEGRWCSAAGKVTVGLAESNGSLPPGGWLKSPAWPCTPGSAPGPTLGNEYGKPLLFYSTIIWKHDFMHKTGST